MLTAYSSRIQVSVCCRWSKSLLKICSNIQLNLMQTFWKHQQRRKF